jgi:Lectin C-type domain
MRKRLFLGISGALALALGACASSAIEDPEESSFEAGVTPGGGSLDAGDPIVTPEPGLDAATRADARVPASDASTLPVEAGMDAAAVKDAALPAHDAQTQPGDGQSTADAGSSCAGSSLRCGDGCVDPRTDGAHCGGCGTVCATGTVCVASVCTAAVTGCTPKSYQSHSYLFCTSARSWSAARSSCLGAGLDLSVVDDAAENTFVSGNGDSWLGASDQDRPGAIVSVVPGNAQRTDGEAVGFTKWAKGEPNDTYQCDGTNVIVGCFGNYVYEDCVEVQADGSWNDDYCSRSKGYICESY